MNGNLPTPNNSYRIDYFYHVAYVLPVATWTKTTNKVIFFYFYTVAYVAAAFQFSV